ncbi:UrcA family protein [Sphingomonas sp. LT1P40]|uniref:UrcA family protein n=1 Tax=Alteristakelama amylovorans TaxID=3096166 RepID=UPI002FCC17C1
MAGKEPAWLRHEFIKRSSCPRDVAVKRDTGVGARQGQPARYRPAFLREPVMNHILPLILLIGAVGSPALAAPSDRIETRVAVSVRDLDLSTDAGQRAFDRRVVAAVSSVCGASAADLATRADVRNCRIAARAGVARRRAELVASASGNGASQLSAR